MIAPMARIPFAAFALLLMALPFQATGFTAPGTFPGHRIWPPSERTWSGAPSFVPAGAMSTSCRRPSTNLTRIISRNRRVQPADLEALKGVRSWLAEGGQLNCSRRRRRRKTLRKPATPPGEGSQPPLLAKDAAPAKGQQVSGNRSAVTTRG